MATNLGTGSSSNGRDSNPKNLGVKVYGGQYVFAGSIIVRQRGTYFKDDGKITTDVGRDHTIFAKVSGFVSFKKKIINSKKRIIVLIGEESTNPNTKENKKAVKVK